MRPFVLLFLLLSFSCKKDLFNKSPQATLSTSVDTLSFDTVFTAAGSITQSFKIFNTNNEKLQLTHVKISGGNSSPFKMNVDGVSSNEVDDVEINANDSIYVFVQVNAPPSDSTLPYILSDSIEIAYNGNKKIVQLQAYGQNAVFLRNKKITGNVLWNNKLPYVIIGGIEIDTNATLNISAGTKIYLHADAPFLVDGTLKTNGTKDQPIIFSGDRLDVNYKDLPASWPGIIFTINSKNNILKQTTIKNAFQGIIAQDLSTTTNAKVVLSQCIIDNIYDAGILGINTNIYSDNSLIRNCGRNIVLQLGGDYRFINCTIASFGNNYITHKNAVLQVSNSLSDNGNLYTAPLKSFFENCIFWGDGGTVENEIVIDKQGTEIFSASFDHVLYKAKDPIENGTFISSIKNENPLFDSINISQNIFDFHFNSHPSSPAVNAGTNTPFLYDLDNKKRDALPDIGCYER